MTILIQNPETFRSITKNLETLQEFKAPFVKTFEKLICGNPAITNEEDAEFCYISPTGEDKKQEKRVKEFIKETEASEDNIAELFYKLAGLLDKFEEEQKKDLVQFTLKRN